MRTLSSREVTKNDTKGANSRRRGVIECVGGNVNMLMCDSLSACTCNTSPQSIHRVATATTFWRTFSI
jgi:hypothetical protein